MFGYVTPIKSELACCDFVLYRSYYCGMCKLIGKQFGQLPRFTTNYDITFLSVLLAGYTQTQHVIAKKNCILNPFKKKPCVQTSPLLERITAANIILSYYKTVDGILDKDGLKIRFAHRMLKPAYKKAAKLLPEVDALVADGYTALRQAEQTHCASIDQAADKFASLLKHVAIALLQLPPDTLSKHTDLLALCYNIGKFVYLADALDDIQDDHKAKRYNPFLASLTHTDNNPFTDRATFIATHHDTLTFLFASTTNRCIESFNNIAHILTSGVDLLQNILYKGLRAKVDDLLTSTHKLKKPNL